MGGVLTLDNLLEAIELIKNEPIKPWAWPPMSKSQYEWFKDTDWGLWELYGFYVRDDTLVSGWAH